MVFPFSILYAQLTITSPVTRMVFQRNLANNAAVTVTGVAPSNATLVEARFIPLAANQGTSTNWSSLSFLSGTSSFRGQVTVNGGWYRLAVRAKNGPIVIAETQVDRIGIGEVFVVAGQSNVFGGLQRVTSSVEDRVSCVDFRQDSISEQLLPLQFSKVSYGSSIGPSQPPHLWSTLGDKLVQRLNVPVLFLGAALGGSSSSEWQQGAVGNMGTTTNSSVYRRLGEALLHYVSRTGARAVLWHQGETDTYYNVTSQTYYNNINAVIQKSRQQVGSQPLAWMISRVSFNNYLTNAGIIAAQNQLITNISNTFPGPASDSIIGTANRPDGIHMKGPGLVRFTNSWDQALTTAFFQNAVPFMPNDPGALITTGYTLPLLRRQGDTLAVASLRSDPYQPSNQYVAQIIRASDGTVVAESSPTQDNPILIKIPTNLPNSQYRVRTRSTNPVILGTLSEPFTIQQSAAPASLLRVLRQPVMGGTPPDAIRRVSYKYDSWTHGFFAMVESTAPVEVKLERIDGGTFTDTGWYLAQPGSQAPDYEEFANFTYVQNYPPQGAGVGGVSPGKYRYSIRLQGNTSQTMWFDIAFIDARQILYQKEPNVVIQPFLTVSGTPTPPACLINPLTVSIEVIDGPKDGIYSVRLSDPTGSFANETTISNVTATGPFTVTLSPELASGTQYRIRVVTSNPNLATLPSQPFSLCNDADLSISMSLSSRLPAVNQPVTLTLVLTNEGPAAVDSTTIRSLLPPGMEFINTADAAIQAKGDTIRIKSGRVDVGTSLPFAFRMKAQQAGRFLTSAQIMTSSRRDPDSQPGSGTGDGQDDAATVDLRTFEESDFISISPNPNQVPLPPVQSNQPPTDPTKADLSLAIVSDQLVVRPNQVAKFTFTVSNSGGATANNVTIRTLLPSGWQLTVTNGLTISGQSVTANIGSITAGNKGTISLFVQVPNSGTLQGQVFSVTPSDPDSTPGNGYTNGEDDTATISVRVR
ncbi:sialate O-acetylesterase [Spirosoma sp.]|uniref:sialate O-acetylesterase n=1 Tax=Spirosoma sp. TaxID=1899569 RepID=UPI0025F2934E|nr:sialate O-acetylesterase [Spirosoma sp.]